jgi:membrane protein DedA with SNARE-associated domain/membrane-associated phospholipid phosphatase
LIATISDLIRSLPAWVALLVVFLAPCLESSAFFGFLFPGEIAVFVGGVIAYDGRLSLGWVIAAAVLGAIVGDTIGYWVGRRYGRRLMRFLFGKVPFVGRRLDRELDRAQAYLKRRGGRAVFFGRYTAALRVLVPGLAGMSDMHYPRFLFWNVTGGGTWAIAFVLLGYYAGAAWHQVERYASRVSLILLGLVILFFISVGLVRRYRRDPERARAARERLWELAPASWARRRFPASVRWLGRRFIPGNPLGLPLTFAVTIGMICAASFALLTSEVSEGGRTYLDASVHAFVLDHRTGPMTVAMRSVTWLGSSVVLVPLLVAVGALFLIRKRDWRPGLALVAAFGGAVVLYNIVKPVVERPRPPVAHLIGAATGFSFPSGHATGAIALWGMLAAVVWARGSSPARGLVWPVAIAIVGAVGASRLYLGAHWFTDVLGGYALGGMWLAILLGAMLGWSGRGARRARPPDGGAPDAERASPVPAQTE